MEKMVYGSSSRWKDKIQAFVVETTRFLLFTFRPNIHTMEIEQIAGLAWEPLKKEIKLTVE